MSWGDFCLANNVGSRFEDANINNLSEEKLQNASEWLKKPMSLILTGKAGRGKTYFSYSLAKEIFDKYGWSCLRWIKSKHLDDEIIKSIKEYGEATYTIKKFCDVPILFLDDFGVDRSTERAERDYYELIDSRWENNRPTVISTNLNPEQLENTYGARIYSRFKDYKWILFDGPDLRGKCPD